MDPNASTSVANEAAAWDALRGILDPEFGLNLVDLGLIYSVTCDDGAISVVMTLTTPTCPAGSWIEEGVRQALAALPGARRVEVAVVFEPPWTAEMLSSSARDQLGLARE